MFFDVLTELCNKKGISPYKACTDIGLNRSAVAKWKNGAIPRGETLEKIANYFHVTTDYLLGGNNQNNITNLPDTYLRLARGAQELGLDDEYVDTILNL